MGLFSLLEIVLFNPTQEKERRGADLQSSYFLDNNGNGDVKKRQKITKTKKK